MFTNTNSEATPELTKFINASSDLSEFINASSELARYYNLGLVVSMYVGYVGRSVTIKHTSGVL
jgi:hypothetical protein